MEIMEMKKSGKHGKYFETSVKTIGKQFWGKLEERCGTKY